MPLKIIKNAPIRAKLFKYSLKIIKPKREDQRICKYTKLKTEA